MIGSPWLTKPIKATNEEKKMCHICNKLVDTKTAKKEGHCFVDTCPAKPHRIQRKRTKGWRMPPNTVYVGRPSKCGNPFRAAKPYLNGKIVKELYLKSVKEAIERFADIQENMRGSLIRKELRGKNLACWCPLDQPCHADVLLEIANS